MLINIQIMEQFLFVKNFEECKKKKPTHMYNVHSTLQYKVNESLRKKTMIKHFTVKKDDKIQ